MGLVAINVHFGDASAGGPAATYAAAGEAGVWNNVTGIAGPDYQLVAVDGTPSGVAVNQAPTTTNFNITDASITGDDAKLLQSGLVTTGAETCLMFSGVPAGMYEVLVYAWTPGSPSVMSRTRQDEAPSTKDIGGAWTGAQVEGVTYARYVVTVGSDHNLPAHSGLAPSMPSAALNGVQIRPLPNGGGGGTPDAGNPVDYGDAGTTPQAKSGGCSTGGGAGGWLALVSLGVLARGARRCAPRRR
jgi:hypothetical protein